MTYILSVGQPHPLLKPSPGQDGAIAEHDDMMWHLYLIVPRPEPSLIDAVEGGELGLGLLPITSRGWAWLLQILPGTVVEATFAPALQHPANRRMPEAGPEGAGRLMIELIDERGILRAIRFVSLPASLYRTVRVLYAEGLHSARTFSRRNWEAAMARYEADYSQAADALPHAIAVHTVPALVKD
ncbi:hypothetical protein [Roseomonas chloroacetimidivorans]|uniref:hypothetical protein n=1 Tax=Roseomonas chloroacetimidivorans TaxID=1766656 RepID=UPI003C767A32